MKLPFCGMVFLLVGCAGVGGSVVGVNGAPTTEASLSPKAPLESASPIERVDSVSPESLPQASWDTVMDSPPPLARYAVYLDGPQPDPAEVATRQEWYDSVESFKAECMAAQGFQYAPNPADASQVMAASRITSTVDLLPVPALPNDRESVQRVGYGVMGTPEEQDAEAGWVGSDPNLAYVQTLSPAEYEAYYFALLGDYNDPAGTLAASCSGQAMARFSEPSTPDRQQAFRTEFRDLLFAVSVLVSGDDRDGGAEDDPRALELDEEWTTCMDAKGYVLDGMGIAHGPVLAMALALRTRPDGTLGTFHRTAVPASEIPVEEQSLLGTEPEREVALADFDCRAQTDYMARLSAIRVDLDEKFIADHQAELDRLVAAAESW